MAEPSKQAELTIPQTPEAFRDLLSRAEKGDKSTLPVVRKLMEDPSNVERFGGNLARYAQGLFIDALSGGDLTIREAILAKLATIRKDLLGDNPTAVERLLADRVAACWLQVQDAEIRYASAKSLTLEQGDYHQRRMDAANRRYLAAVKALALVRKLAAPVLQVNIAKRQVNVAAPAAVSTPTG